MNAKKIIKGIVKLGVMGGIAYAAYKLGECNGEVNERMREKYGDEDEDDNRYPAETFEMNYSNDDAELEKSGYGIIDEEDLKENGSDDDDFSDDGFSDGEPIDFGEDE